MLNSVSICSEAYYLRLNLRHVVQVGEVGVNLLILGHNGKQIILKIYRFRETCSGHTR